MLRGFSRPPRLNGPFIPASCSQVHLLKAEFRVRDGQVAAAPQINTAGLILLTARGKPIEFKSKAGVAFFEMGDLA